MAIFEIEKDGIWSTKLFLKLIYMISRIMEFFNFSGPHAEFSNIISYISVIYIQIFIQDELNGFITSPSRSISDPLKKIHDVIKAVREGPTPLPSSILYRFAN